MGGLVFICNLLQKPAFADNGDELGDLLRHCKDVPQLDMFSDESRMDVPAAMVCGEGLGLSEGGVRGGDEGGVRGGKREALLGGRAEGRPY